MIGGKILSVRNGFRNGRTSTLRGEWLSTHTTRHSLYLRTSFTTTKHNITVLVSRIYNVHTHKTIMCAYTDVLWMHRCAQIYLEYVFVRVRVNTTRHDSEREFYNRALDRARIYITATHAYMRTYNHTVHTIDEWCSVVSPVASPTKLPIHFILCGIWYIRLGKKKCCILWLDGDT